MFYGNGNSMFIINPFAFGGITFDPDAQAFITAAGITDATQKSAINTLVLDLKSYSLWTKMKAIYPFVGGTATTHKFNLKDPRDLDAAFRIIFIGGFTHNSNGVTGNGSNAVAYTALVPNTRLTVNNTHISVYSRSAEALDRSEIGCSNSFLPILGLSVFTQTGLLTQFDGYDFTTHRITGANLDGRGLFLGSIINSTSQKLYKNSTSIATQTASQTQGLPNTYEITLFGRNDSGNVSGLSSRNLAFSTIGDGLTDAEVSNFYTAIQQFQTSLSRQV